MSIIKTQMIDLMNIEISSDNLTLRLSPAQSLSYHYLCSLRFLWLLNFTDLAIEKRFTLCNQ